MPPPSLGQGLTWGCPLHAIPPPTILARGGGRFRAAPSSPKQMELVPLREHGGGRSKANSRPFLAPVFLSPSPRVLCVSLSWLSITSAASGHTEVNAGTLGPHWATRVMVVSGPGHPGARAVCATLNESHSTTGFLGACPRSRPHPSLTHLPLPDDVKATGAAEMIQSGAPKPRAHAEPRAPSLAHPGV